MSVVKGIWRAPWLLALFVGLMVLVIAYLFWKGEPGQGFAALSALSSIVMTAALIYFYKWTIQQRTPDPIIVDVDAGVVRDPNLVATSSKGERVYLRVTLVNPGDGAIFIFRSHLSHPDRTLMSAPNLLIPPYTRKSFKIRFFLPRTNKTINDLAFEDFVPLRLVLEYTTGGQQRKQAFGCVGFLGLAKDGTVFFPSFARAISKYGE